MPLQQPRGERLAETLAEQASADAAGIDVGLQRPRDVLDHRIAQLKAICDLDAAGIDVQLARDCLQQRVGHTHDQSRAALLGFPRRRRARRNDVEIAGDFAAVAQPSAARARDFHRRSEVHADDRVRQRGDLREPCLERVDRDGDGRVCVRCRAVALLATCSLTELMLLPPRIQLLLCREYNESPATVPAVLSQSPSVHAPRDLNVQQKPYSARVQSHFAAETPRPIRLIAS